MEFTAKQLSLFLVNVHQSQICIFICQWRRSDVFIVNFEHVITGWDTDFYLNNLACSNLIIVIFRTSAKLHFYLVGNVFTLKQ